MGTDPKQLGNSPKEKKMINATELTSLIVGSGMVGYGLYKTTLVKIDANHLGLPEHILKGRFIKKRVEQNNGRNIYHYELPEPFLEGWHLKSPLLKVRQYDQGTKKIKLDNVEFQTEGGSIFVNGVIVFRVSAKALFRVMETDDTRIDTLETEIKSALTKEFVGRKINDAISEIGEIADELIKELMRFPTDDEDQYFVNGEKLRRMETLCGIEVVSSTLERPEPEEKIKEMRNKIAEENYQTTVKTIERLQVWLDQAMYQTFGTNPDLAANLSYSSQVGELPPNINYKSFHTDGGKKGKPEDLGKQLRLLEALQNNSNTTSEQQNQIAEMLTLIKAMGDTK